MGDSHFPADGDALRIFELYDPIRNKKYKKELVKVGFFELSKNNIETINQRYWRDYFLTGEAHKDAPEYIIKASHIIEYENLSKEERNVSELLEKARADYDAGFSSAYHDGIEVGIEQGIEQGRDEGLDLSTQIISALLKQTPTEEIAARYNTSIQKVNNLRSALTQVSA